MRRELSDQPGELTLHSITLAERGLVGKRRDQRRKTAFPSSFTGTQHSGIRDVCVGAAIEGAGKRALKNRLYKKTPTERATTDRAETHSKI